MHPAIVKNIVTEIIKDGRLKEMMSLEDKIFDFSKTLADIADYDNAYSLKLNINDNFFIKASHVVIENNEWLYNIILYENEEIIDSIYCDRIQEELEDIIIFLIEEYVEL